jgi:pyruvate kinase
MRHARIVGTIGPSSTGKDRIRRLVDSGLDVARLNFSHGTREAHEETYEDIRQVSEEVGRPIAILADLSGPKIRIGEVGQGGVSLEPGRKLVITTEPLTGTAERVSVNHASLPREVHPGQSLFLDDGLIELVVVDVTGNDIRTEVKTGGLLKSRKGLNAPNAGSSIPALTDKDRSDLEFARKLGVDWFALSFVRNAADLDEAKRLAGDIPVMAKVEKPQAIERLDEIADAADGLMVARGDLGIEIGFEKVPLLQKRIIRAAAARAKPVITATQMLESMVHSPFPTRAEVSDVANAVLDGTDAVMLSAETASGDYPFAAVRTMARIIKQVESEGSADAAPRRPAAIDAPNFQNAIAHSAARAAIELKLAAVVVWSHTGRSIGLVSAHRPGCPIVGIVPPGTNAARHALEWGVRPLNHELPRTPEAIIAASERLLLERGLANPGEEVAIAFSLADLDPTATTNLMLWRIRGERV